MQTFFSRLIRFYLFVVLIISASGQAWSVVDFYQFDNAEQEIRYQGLIEQLRCPKCQNQNLANSDAPIAKDLKQTTYELIQAGNSDEQIRQFMQERYGDFINYKPPMRPATYVLWFLPPFVLIIAIMCWVWHIHQRNIRMAHIVDKHSNCKNETR